MRPCAAPSCSRIDLTPSIQAVTLAVVWIGACCGVILFAVDLSLPARIVICICVATANLLSLQSVFLLRGPNAIRSISWSETGQLVLRLGPTPREVTAILAPGSARLGRDWLLLWLASCDGVHGVLIHAAGQEAKVFGRLCRMLEGRRNAHPDEQKEAS